MNGLREKLCGMLMVFLMTAVPVFGEPVQGKDDAVAVVNGAVLTNRDLKEVFDEIMPGAFYHQTINPEKIAEIKKEALDKLIERELYYQEAKRTRLKVKRSKVNDFYAKVEKKFKKKEALRNALKAAGYTEKSFKEKIRKKFMIEKFYEEEVFEKAKVTEDFLKEYYEKNKESYLRPEARRLRHILIKVEPTATNEERKKLKERAEEVLKKAKEGGDFAQLAWDYSMGEYRVKGGDLGMVHKGMLVPEVEKEAFTLKTGEISGIIESIYGYHVIKVEEKMPPTQMTFEEIKDKLKKDLEEKRKQELEEALIKRLKAKAEIKIYMKE